MKWHHNTHLDLQVLRVKEIWTSPSTGIHFVPRTGQHWKQALAKVHDVNGIVLSLEHSLLFNNSRNAVGKQKCPKKIMQRTWISIRFSGGNWNKMENCILQSKIWLWFHERGSWGKGKQLGILEICSVPCLNTCYVTWRWLECQQ